MSEGEGANEIIKKTKNSASEIFARADGAPAACEGPRTTERGGRDREGSHPELRARIRVDRRVCGGCVAARGRGEGEGVAYAQRACEAREDAYSGYTLDRRALGDARCCDVSVLSELMYSVG